MESTQSAIDNLVIRLFEKHGALAFPIVQAGVAAGKTWRVIAEEVLAAIANK